MENSAFLTIIYIHEVYVCYKEKAHLNAFSHYLQTQQNCSILFSSFFSFSGLLKPTIFFKLSRVSISLSVSIGIGKVNYNV